METKKFTILIADKSHAGYIKQILKTIEESAKVRGTGIAHRTYQYLFKKMKEGKAVIALCGTEFAGFSYIETWENKKFIATSGLIVANRFRGQGLSWEIKQKTFQIARERWPNAKIFSITTGSAVMRMNEKLGYRSVALSDLTKDETFWQGCKECRNHDILERSQRKFCCCSAMMFDSSDQLCISKLHALKNL
ncbi:N-acetyltransferase [Bacteroidia bacterium]|nr:N-acetyltransferase [Bacteroidia bacterium]